MSDHDLYTFLTFILVTFTFIFSFATVILARHNARRLNMLDEIRRGARCTCGLNHRPGSCDGGR